MRSIGFLTAVAVATMTHNGARAEFLYIKIDLSKIYETMPKNPGGTGIVGMPPVEKQPNPMGIPTTGSLVEGPFVTAIFDIKGGKWNFEPNDKKKRSTDDIVAGEYTGGIKVDFHQYGRDARFIVWPDFLKARTPTMKYSFIRRDSVAREFEMSFKKELAGSKDVKKFVNAATWALTHGLTSEFHSTMEELKKLDPKHPVVVNYTRVKDGLAKPPELDDPAIRQIKKDFIGDLKDKHHVAPPSEKGYYFALSSLPSEFDGGVKVRTNRLHDVMENFYYWFAMNEQLPQPALPQYKQMLVVTPPNEFYAKHSQWGAQPFTNDGVTPRRDNFILTSWRPLDDAYRSFSSNNQELCNKLAIKAPLLVNGLIWEKGRLRSDQDPFSVAYAQTLMLVQKSMEDQSEYATLSHEGTRQLLFSSGILPRNVHTPEWIASGIASYFETPVGSLYKGIGLPSWTNHVTFKHLRDQKKLDKKSATDVLMNVICDRYFRSAQRYSAELNDAPDKEKLNERIREEMDLACSTSWAFAYYIIERRRQPQLLFRYCQELNALPRDLDLDERALEACFAKVFDVADPANPSRIDRAKLKTLADAWFAEMDGVTLDVPELQNEYLELRKLDAKRAAN